MKRIAKAAGGKVLSRLNQRQRGVALAVGGMATLMTGGKVTALGLFSSGFRDLEEAWREAHPEFTGGKRERWRHAIEFYEATHKDPTNRKLHVIGIPIIVGGAAGMLLWPRYTPPWFLSAFGFGAGWALNILGHAAFEKNAPAFADDPLSFIAGPIWDLKHLRQILSRGETVSVAGGPVAG